MKQITGQYQTLLPEGLVLGIGDRTDRLPEEILSEVELNEYNKFQNRRRKDEFLSARGLIKKLVTEIGLDETMFEVHKDRLGQPFGVYQNRSYNLSLAHTGEKVLCGISAGISIGVDMEPAGRIVDERLKSRMLHPEEGEFLKKESLIRIWTLKEALVKLEGKGLRTNLNQIIIRPENESEFTGKFNNDKSARICSFQYDNYWIAVAFYR